MSRFYGIAYTDTKAEWNAFENKLQNRDGRTTIVEGDQSDTKFLMHLRRRLLRAEPDGFDLIVDDGSHIPSHQLLSLIALWPLLKPGGNFAVEDVETSYWGRFTSVYDYPMADEFSFF